LTSLLEDQKSDEKGTISGLKIVLSQSALDSNDVGYQKPEAKGFWKPKKMNQEKAYKTKKYDAEAAPNPITTVTEKVEELKQVERRRPKKQAKQQEQSQKIETEVSVDKPVESEAPVNGENVPKNSNKHRNSRKPKEEKKKTDAEA
jgi:hypothetical protein